jgi:chromosome segregation ATPase
MQSLFVFILVSAGVLMALMGVFLIASEKELKSKRREVETLLAKLEDALKGNVTGPASAPTQDNSPQLAELRAANQDLQSQIAGLSGKLELSRRAIAELEATQQNNAGDQDQTRELRAANEQLKMELNELRSRLRDSEARAAVTVAAHPDAGQQQLAQAQSEIAGLRQKLDDSQAKIRGLETAQQNAVNVAALEAQHLDERQRLQARIAEMDKEVSTVREKLRELDTLRVRCAESEQAQQSLRDEIRRHDEEIPRWQARIAEAEAHREQLSALQKPYSELLSKQVSMLEKQRELQEDLEAFARLMAAPTDAVQTMTSFASSIPSQAAAQTAAPAEEPKQATAAAQPEPKRARRFGIFPVVILLLAAGGLGTWYVGFDSSESTMPTVTASTQSQNSSPAAQRQRETHLQPESSAVTPGAASAPSMVKEPVRPAVKNNSESASVSPPVKRTPRVGGTYQITRASRVYARPTEFSQSIGDIEPGVKVSVVDSRDGWLEIHSKHGRPPGFIRSDVAARVSAQD